MGDTIDSDLVVFTSVCIWTRTQDIHKIFKNEKAMYCIYLDSVIIELPTIYDTDNYLGTFSPNLDFDNSLLKRKPIMGLIRKGIVCFSQTPALI